MFLFLVALCRRQGLFCVVELYTSAVLLWSGTLVATESVQYERRRYSKPAHLPSPPSPTPFPAAVILAVVKWFVCLGRQAAIAKPGSQRFHGFRFRMTITRTCLVRVFVVLRMFFL